MTNKRYLWFNTQEMEFSRVKSLNKECEEAFNINKGILPVNDCLGNELGIYLEVKE